MIKLVPRKIFRIAFGFILLLILVIGAINLYILQSAKGRIFYQVSSVPAGDIGLVMGTDMLRFNGSTNLHFFLRSEGAAMLYQSGKAKRLLIIGNPNNSGFNEVNGMAKEILARNVPESAFILDEHGISTWESLKRATEVYHVHKIIIVTDSFHASRAIYLSRHFGIEAMAFCHGSEPFGFWAMRYHVREWLARVKAFLQVLADRRESHG